MSTTEERFHQQAIPLVATGEARVEARTRTRAGQPIRTHARELLQTVLLKVVIFFSVRAVVQNFRVEGASMEPTLQTGQYLLINKAAYFRMDDTSPLARVVPGVEQGSTHYVFGGPERGDIVVFEAPTQQGKDFIKRVIGLPGDMVQVKSGKVYVNGNRLVEPYLEFEATYNYPVSGQPIRVPDDSYFVLGDNRPNSSDSHLGWFVPEGNLIGKAWVSYWPPAHWGVMPHAAYAN
jgi:signal peptidase I